jgi:GDPmannose 4,6-dehydratase
VVDPKLTRPAEVDLLCGDCKKARERLGWNHEINFHDLVREMIAGDLELFSQPIEPVQAAAAPQ